MTTSPLPSRKPAPPAGSRQQHLTIVRERAFILVVGASILAFGAVAAGGLSSNGTATAERSKTAESGDHDNQLIRVIAASTSHRPAHARTRSS